MPRPAIYKTIRALRAVDGYDLERKRHTLATGAEGVVDQQLWTPWIDRGWVEEVVKAAGKPAVAEPPAPASVVDAAVPPPQLVPGVAPAKTPPKAKPSKPLAKPKRKQPKLGAKIRKGK